MWNQSDTFAGQHEGCSGDGTCPGSLLPVKSENLDDYWSMDKEEIIITGIPRQESGLDLLVPSPSSSSGDSDKSEEKRKRNNQASKKFRQARKGKQQALFAKESELERENYSLKVQVEQLIRELNQLKAALHGGSK
ncbi:transcription factor ces-2 [Nematostella vectensis]|nr:transcription factor ces-2 [Nematostella vectensis]